ncbi:hypothetical protein GLAREA_06844 [Glarea lozoyensis ATCC 20868]|uniref:Uncharacterized protein n=2 Tax=Glarea lozoyensis TaxID=101852 RepID=S3DP27_GLAL2|nr:uncharacterized protein GLAREA_06844 [Glarea lozoyensis ATCC 20868]EHK99531.1 hypothetical protein M7I_4601 [Glarea lozoyensis 74030]EPE33831.1 hypothetical protein GLAREA_06844 [Glarea lozoyensis ATCC 20868]
MQLKQTALVVAYLGTLALSVPIPDYPKQLYTMGYNDDLAEEQPKAKQLYTMGYNDDLAEEAPKAKQLYTMGYNDDLAEEQPKVKQLYTMGYNDDLAEETARHKKVHHKTQKPGHFWTLGWVYVKHWLAK